MLRKFLDATVRQKVANHLEPVRISFANVAKDIHRLDDYGQESRDLIERWNAYFLQMLQNLEQKHREHKVFEHIQVVPRLKSEIEQLHSAHTALYNSLKRQQDSADLIKSDLQRTQLHVAKVIEQYNKCFVTVFDQLKVLREDINQSQKTHSESPISQVSHTRSESLAPNASVSSQRVIGTLRDMATALTTSERQILSILMSTGQKLSYKDIAVTYGRSPSTIKNIICRIKSKGVPLFETAAADGIKRYYLDENFKKVLTQGRV